MSQESTLQKLKSRIDELEAELRTKSADYGQVERILSSLETGLSLINPDKTIAWVNAKTRVMFPHGDPVGQICHRFYESSDEPCRPCPALKCFETGTAQTVERFNPANNRWYGIISQPITDSSGKVVNVIEGITDITEEKETLETILRERDFLNRVMETSPVGIVMVDREGRITLANTRAEEILGLERSDILNRLYNDPAWHITDIEGNPFPDDRLPFQRVRRGGSPVFSMEHAVVWPDNRRVLLSINAAPLFDGGGNFNGMVATLEDITDRRLAEDTIRKNEELFRLITENTADIIWTLDLDLNTTYVSPSIEKILGFTPDERLRQPMEEMLTPESLRRVWAMFQNELDFLRDTTADPDRSASIDVEYYHKDGSIVWMENKIKVVRDPSGSAMGILGVSRDRTERKRAEGALRESEKRLIAAQRMARLGDFKWDLATGEGTWSDALFDLFGFDKSEKIDNARINAEIHHPDDRERITKWLNDSIASGRDKLPPNEYRVIRPDGKVLHVRTSGIIEREEGQSPRIFATVQDITDIKKMEEELRLAQKMEALGTLSGGIAHEFNNILGIIMGNAELAMLDMPGANPVKRHLEEILIASIRARDVVGQILSFSSRTPGAQTPLKIGPVIQEALNLIRATTPANIEMRQEILCDSETILANQTEVNQILINLCGNAVQAITEETGILEVKLETVVLDDLTAAQYEGLKAGAYAKLTVKDNGLGIDSRIMDRIFDPYFTTKDVDEGLGMGLAVVYGLLKKHRGVVRIKSKSGQGTTAEALFPLIDDSPEAELAEAAESPAGTERILFVDDEGSLVTLYKQMLEREGYQVVGQTSSPEALRQFQEEPDKFDLIVTDMAMPDMPGDRLAQEIIKIRSDIPIILCTGHSDRVDEDQAGELGISAYVMKPLTRTDLLNTIRKMLDKVNNRPHE